MEARYLALVILLVPFCTGEIVDPATVECGTDEFLWCEYNNTLVPDGAAPRKCNDTCICEGHPSFHGDNLDWIDDKCVTPRGFACGNNLDGSITIYCAEGSQCLAGRCRDPNASKLALGKRCKDDYECEDGLGCQVFFVASTPLPTPGSTTAATRRRRAIGPQRCCHHPNMGNTEHSLDSFPCGSD